ncbi:NAD-dependent epimerase/dehydratase family protein [Candidatus Saccharibacteria bacterium]|nr:NAD-dependent epimerase/dehydratase family protein [Candidatus Saccharibacteria bacterium]
MASTVLITGVNGFVGKHLARELKKRGVKVIGVGREVSLAPELQNTLSDYWVCDLTHKAAVTKLPLKSIEGLISLAGLARVGDSFADPEKYEAVNVGVLANLCQDLLGKKLNPRIIAVSTAAVYEPNQPLPLTENSKLTKDGSPYAMSKLLMERSASQFRARGLELIIVRPFNHIGPGQEEGFLVPDLFAKLRAAKFSGETIKVGNLSTKRDYTDVRDVARAYADLALAGSLDYDLYNIGSGKSVAGQQMLNLLLEKTGKSGQIKIETDSSLLRPNDIADIFGSYQRLNQQTGWKPLIPLEKTIEDFVNSFDSSA